MVKSVEYYRDHTLTEIIMVRKRWYYEEEGTLWEDITLYTPQGEYTKTVCVSNAEASPLRGLYWLINDWNIDLSSVNLPIISFPSKFYLPSGEEDADEIEDVDEYDMWGEIESKGYYFVVEQH